MRDPEVLPQEHNLPLTILINKPSSVATTWDPSSQASDHLMESPIENQCCRSELGMFHSDPSKVTVLKQNWQILFNNNNKKQMLLFDLTEAKK